MRLNHERVGHSITSIRAHGPEQCRFCACALHLLAPNRCCVTTDVLMHFHSMATTDSIQGISGGLAKSPARCSTRPVHRPKLQVAARVAACSRADASHGLRDVNVPPGRAITRGTRLLEYKRPVELPFAPDLGCTAQPRACGSKYHLNPSSWARAVPVLRLRLASTEVYRETPPGLQSTCSCPSTP